MIAKIKKISATIPYWSLEREVSRFAQRHLILLCCILVELLVTSLGVLARKQQARAFQVVRARTEEVPVVIPTGTSRME